MNDSKFNKKWEEIKETINAEHNKPTVHERMFMAVYNFGEHLRATRYHCI